MPDVKLTPFTGIDNVTGEPNLPAGAFLDARNVDVTRMGGVRRRDGYTLALAGASCVGTSKALNALLVVLSGTLTALSPETLAQTALGAVADTTDLAYVDVNDEVVVAGPATLGVIRAGALQGLGVEQPPPPMVAADDAGGLRAGRYGVLITFLAADGEESAASEAIFVTVPEGGGIRVNGLPVPQEAKTTQVRAYRTGCDGDVFYRVDSVASGSLIGEGRRGRACDTRHTSRMRGGLYLRYWRGRILVARGRTLYMSEAMRYGLYDTRHGFIQMPTRITFIQPVEGGIYVGQTDGVHFLAGASPADLKVVRTGAAAPTPGSALEVGSSEMSGEFAQGAEKHAVWWGARGYAVGQPNGSVVEPQSKRLAVPVGQRGASVVHERRLISLVS